MELRQELEKLNRLKSVDVEGFEQQYLLLKEKFTSAEDGQVIDDYVVNMPAESAKRIDDFIQEATIKLQLQRVSRIVSFSYIAKTYFHKTFYARPFYN